MGDGLTLLEKSGIGMPGHDDIRWNCDWTIEKFDVRELKEVDPRALAVMSSEQQLKMLVDAGLKPYEVLERYGNLVMYGGVSVLWQQAIGNGTTTADQTLTYFSNARAAIGVGDSSAAVVQTHNDMQAATNKLRKAMDATYPQHTDGTAVGNASIVFRSTFGSSDANWAWNEWGVFNSVTAATGRMLNRKQEANGTKASGASWTFTATLSIA